MFDTSKFVRLLEKKTESHHHKGDPFRHRLFLIAIQGIVRNHIWEHIFHIATHFVEIEMLETSVARRMEQNHNQHDLRHRYFAITMVVSLFSVGLFYAFG